MMTRPIRVAISAGCLMLLAATGARAQDLSVREVLSFLVTNQGVPTADFVKDRAAAEATRDTIGRALLVELATLPISTSSGGFAYQLNPELGTIERVSENFGPFFLDRAVTSGRGQASIGVSFRHTGFDSLDGRNLTDGTLVTTANQFQDEVSPFDVERLTLRLRSSMVTLVGNYGLSDRLDVGIAVPMVTVRLEGERTNIYRGESLLQARGTATSTGLADVAIRTKYHVLKSRAQGIAAGVELRLPTGSEEDLRGAGKASIRISGIGSIGRGPIEGHVNVAISEGGISREIAYGGAVGWAAASRLTFSGEILARRVQALGRIQEVVDAHPLLDRVETIRLLAVGGNATTGIAVAGMKWNVAATLLLNASVLVPLTDRGMTPGLVPSISLDYAFTR